jgi:hypothetical protein
VRGRGIKERKMCGGCKREFLEDTLRRNGGKCKRCADKEVKEAKEREGKGREEEKEKDKREKCKGGCERYYKVDTLKRNGGMCKRCHDKRERGETGRKVGKEQPKYLCKGVCQNRYTETTLRTYGGMCKRCYDKKKKEEEKGEN